jgi:hypothetical protein
MGRVGDVKTLREIATAHVEAARDELAADGLLDDRGGCLAGAVVDNVIVAVQEWLSQPGMLDLMYSQNGVRKSLLREAERKP